MNLVTQQDPLGCGAACISFITQNNYQEVVTILGKDQAEYKGFYYKDLTTVLSTLGFAYTYKYLKPRLKSKIYKMM